MSFYKHATFEAWMLWLSLFDSLQSLFGLGHARRLVLLVWIQSKIRTVWNSEFVETIEKGPSPKIKTITLIAVAVNFIFFLLPSYFHCHFLTLKQLINCHPRHFTFSLFCYVLFLLVQSCFNVAIYSHYLIYTLLHCFFSLFSTHIPTIFSWFSPMCLLFFPTISSLFVCLHTFLWMFVRVQGALNCPEMLLWVHEQAAVKRSSLDESMAGSCSCRGLVLLVSHFVSRCSFVSHPSHFHLFSAVFPFISQFLPKWSLFSAHLKGLKD